MGNSVVHIYIKYQKIRWTLREPMAKTSKIRNFFVMKNPQKNSSKNSKFWFNTFLPNMVVHFHAKYRKIGWKLREPIGFEKKKLTTMDGWWADGSVSNKRRYVSSGAKNWSTKNKYARESVVVHSIYMVPVPFGEVVTIEIPARALKNRKNLQGRIGCQLHEK